MSDEKLQTLSQISLEYCTTLLHQTPYLANQNLLLDEFLKNPKRILLLLGSAGSGKTFTCCHWAVTLSQNKNSFIPIYIPISSQETQYNVITAFFEKHQCSAEEINTFKKDSRILFILEDYHPLQNIWVVNQLEEWQAKIIITSCPEFFVSTNYHLYFTPLQKGKRQPHLLTEITLTPWTEDQINHYLQLHHFSFQLFTEHPFLKELCRNPLFLKILTEQQENGNTNQLLNQLFNHWFTYHEEKFKQTGQWDKKDNTFKTRCWEYSVTLAKQMQQKKISEVDYSPSYSFISKENSWERFFTTRDPMITLLRSACPLKKIDSRYSFMHPALLDHLAQYQARTLKPVKPNEEPSIDKKPSVEPLKKVSSKVPTRLLNHLFNLRLFINDITQIQMFADLVQQNETFKKELFDLVYASIEEEGMAIAAANAITILNAARVSFSGMDLSDIKIRYANLEGAILDSTLLQNADLRNVNLQNAWLRNADFTGAQMEGVKFGELPFVELPAKPIVCQFSSNGSNVAIVTTKEDDIYLYGTLLPTPLYIQTVDENSLETNIQVARSTVISMDGCFIALIKPRYRKESEESAKENEIGEVELWNILTSKRLHIIKISLDIPSSLAFSADSQQLAIGCSSGNIYLCNVSSGTLSSILLSHSKEVMAISFNSTGDLLVSSDEIGLHIWDAKNNTYKYSFKMEEIQQTEENILTASNDKSEKIIFSSDSHYLAHSSLDIKIW